VDRQVGLRRAHRAQRSLEAADRSRSPSHPGPAEVPRLPCVLCLVAPRKARRPRRRRSLPLRPVPRAVPWGRYSSRNHALAALAPSSSHPFRLDRNVAPSSPDPVEIPRLPCVPYPVASRKAHRPSCRRSLPLRPVPRAVPWARHSSRTHALAAIGPSSGHAFRSEWSAAPSLTYPCCRLRAAGQQRPALNHHDSSHGLVLWAFRDPPAAFCSW
jgi:hypothetical protein